MKGACPATSASASLAIVGHAHDNDTSTGEIVNEVEVAVEFTTPNTGAFKTGNDEPESMPVLFNFDFSSFDNGALLSHGEWAGKGGSSFHFVASPPDRFTLTVVPKDTNANGAELIIHTGRKILPAAERTFFQQYGAILMIAVFFVVQKFMTNRMQQNMQTQPRRSGAPAAAVEVAAKKSK